MSHPKLVPELYCTDINRSLKFYRDILGFSIVFQRPEECFAYLALEGSELMIEEFDLSSDRSWLTGKLEAPFGRGVNFQIEVADVMQIYKRAKDAGVRIFLDLEEKWYRTNVGEAGSRQFIVQDPDGFLLRFFQDIGMR